MNSRLIRLMRRLSHDTGAHIDELLESAKALLAKRPKLTPDEIDELLRAHR